MSAHEIGRIAERSGRWRSLTVEVERPTSVRVRAHVDHRHLDALADSFPNRSDCTSSDCTAYFLTGDRGERLVRDLLCERVSALGLFDPESNTALIAGPGSRGFIRSCVLGLAARAQLGRGYFPAHACLFDLGCGGVLAAGGHRAGKTTLLIESLIRVDGHGTVATDDWALCRLESDGPVGYAVDPVLAIDRDAAGLLNKHHVTAEVDRRRRLGRSCAYLGASQIWPSARDSTNLSIRTILLLDPSDDVPLISVADPQFATEFLVQSAYHMPDVELEPTRSRDFWSRVVSEVPTWVVNPQAPESLRECAYDQLAEILVAS